MRNTGTNVANILTIDVEDWYMNIDISKWDLYENRVFESTNNVLNILNEYDTKATFFILGYVAEHFPELVQRIKNQGHEIATHGYSHKMITKQKPLDFKEDLLKSIKILEEITGNKVMGYRAPWFTIVKETAWAIDILKDAGLKYDSSVFPVKTHRYGLPNAPQFPYNISSKDLVVDNPKEDFLEYPLSVYRIPFLNINMPIAGGFYFRLFPYSFIKYALKNINKIGKSAICYIHPWELDPHQPRIKELGWYHYYNLPSMEKKFKRLLTDFEFESFRS